MSDGAQNHYQVLRIERTADERAIKKAYFTLIRQFPPDTHPEEFKSLRAAYEVLSDPVARQRFDDAEKDFGEYGEEVGAELKGIEQVQKSGDEPEVQRRLKALIEEHPELTIARENLGFSYLRGNAFKEALEQFTELAEQKPEEGRYHLYRGLALNRLEQADKALAAVRKAHKLKPEDLGIHLALIDILKAQRKFTDTVKEIDAALGRQAPKSEQALVLGLRRADAYLCMANAEEAAEEVEQLRELIAEMGDPELPKYVSSQLAAAAARLFARDEHDRANAALAKCQEIFPQGEVFHPYPAVTELDVAALPAVGVAWLARQTPGANSPTLAETIWARPILALLGASVAAAVFLTVIFDAPTSWGVVEALTVAVILVGLGLAFGYAARAVLGIIKSPLRAFTTLHPLYLLRVRGDRIRVYSLFHLTNIRAVHHHTNGVYTHTAVNLSFGKAPVTLSLRGKDFAQGWVQYLVGSRGRSLELMAEGYLEAEHGVELIPPSLLTKASRRAEAKGDLLRWYGRAAAAGAAAALVTLVWHARAADSYAYRLAVRGQTVESYNAYLAHAPTGHHAPDAKRHRALAFKHAEGELRAATRGDAPGLKGLLAALDALEAAGAVNVPVTVESRVDAGGNNDLGAPQGALGPAALADRAGGLVERLDRTLAGAGLSEVMRLHLLGTAGAEDAPVTLTIRPHLSPDGSVLRGEGLNVAPSIKVDWEVVLAKKGASEPLFRFTTTAEAPAEVELARPSTSLASSSFAATALGALVDSAYDTFADRFVLALGLPGAARRAPPGSQSGRGKDGSGP